MSQENKPGQIFRKTNISYPLMDKRTCAYQGVRNVRFSENLSCFVFLKHPFSDSPFALLPTISSLFCKIFIHPLAEWKKKTNKTKNKKQRSVMWMDCIYKTNEMLWSQNWKSFDCMSFLRKEFTQFPRHRNIAVQKILKIHYHITQPA